MATGLSLALRYHCISHSAEGGPGAGALVLQQQVHTTCTSHRACHCVIALLVVPATTTHPGNCVFYLALLVICYSHPETRKAYLPKFLLMRDCVPVLLDTSTFIKL